MAVKAARKSSSPDRVPRQRKMLVSGVKKPQA
jgi:hypothetical protein